MFWAAGSDITSWINSITAGSKITSWIVDWMIMDMIKCNLSLASHNITIKYMLKYQSSALNIKQVKTPTWKAEHSKINWKIPCSFRPRTARHNLQLLENKSVLEFVDY